MHNHHSHNINIKNSHPIEETDFYKKIEKVLTLLDKTGLIDRGMGQCYAMSDIVLKMLHSEGIDAELVECSLLVLYKNPPRIHIVGYSGFGDVTNFADQMQNHVVCVTKTPIPFLIDASIKNVDKNVKYVCVPITGKEEHTNIVEHDFGESVWTYQAKLNSELPALHQKSILERIKTDIKLNSDISLLKRIIFLLALLTSFNFIRGSYDFYQKYVNQTNDFGPTRQLVQEQE
jgi:hypothetical protein